MYKPGAILGITSVDEIEDNANVLPVDPTTTNSSGKKSKTDALKEKLGINAPDAIEAEVVPAVSDRISAIITEKNIPVTLDEVCNYLRSLNLLNGYGVDELEKYPANYKKKMSGDLTNLVNKAAEWVNVGVSETAEQPQESLL